MRRSTPKPPRPEEFYREYFAVLDLAAEFYLETVRQVFQEHRLARGELYWRGELVDPAAIRRTVLLTVEGERDDICGIGQTGAAHDFCDKIPLVRRFVAEKVKAAPASPILRGRSGFRGKLRAMGRHSE